jgi:tetracycline 7-halogenase / FADH2 O2-dependent halogenase
MATDSNSQPVKHKRVGVDHDVVIIGSGLAGTITAACLARNGIDVLVLDAGKHPRFAIGESTIPYTSMLMRLVSERYGVPEIKLLATFEGIQENVTSNCGIKRSFGFLYHKPGQSQNPEQCNQFPIPKSTYSENHFYRQDTDQWMLGVAARYGARIRERVRITDVEVYDTHVSVINDKGEEFTAKYLVDASGFRSVLAQKFQLREEPTRLRTHSRSLFTHMVGVEPYENTVTPRGVHNNPSPWSQGTLHHLFPGGWMWVIPFDNHAMATNPLCSVGVNFDPRVHPKPDVPPEQEFADFLNKFPDVRKQFANARPVRDWVSTGRLQYSSKQTVGARWVLTSHAAGFIDALFSRGLQNTMEIVNCLVSEIIDAVRDDDFNVERFEYIQDLEQSLLDFNDDLVSNAYTSFGDWNLWDAWYRVWAVGQILANFEVNRVYGKFLEDRDENFIKHITRNTVWGAYPDYGPARDLLKTVSEWTQQVHAGSLPHEVAADKIFELLAKADFIPPAFGFADRSNRWYNATIPRTLRTLAWAKREAPAGVADLVYEGFTSFMRNRLSPSEFNVIAEIKHSLAELPVIGRPLKTSRRAVEEVTRTPAPR